MASNRARAENQEHEATGEFSGPEQPGGGGVLPLRGNLALPRKIVLPLRGRARKTCAVISIAQLFGKPDRFFELLNDSARSAHESIEALARMLEQADGAVSLAELAVARRAEKRTAEIIGEELVKVFVTALEREDIEALSGALYRIPKTVEKFGERFDLVRHLVRGEQFASQMALAKEAAAVVVRMVAMLGKSPKLEAIKAANDTIQELESRADQLVLGNLRDIYSGRMDPITAMAARDLFDLLEKVIDRCRDAGKIVAYIVLKNS